MIAPFILAAVTNVATQFFDDFGGAWRCGNARYSAPWKIVSPDGDYWTIVTYGPPDKPGGVAYVGYLPQMHVYVYHDYHADGSFADLTASAPSDRTWHFTGSYYPAGGAKDDGPDITWTLTPQGTIQRVFSQRVDGKLIERGRDTCTKI